MTSLLVILLCLVAILAYMSFSFIKQTNKQKKVISSLEQQKAELEESLKKSKSNKNSTFKCATDFFVEMAKRHQIKLEELENSGDMITWRFEFQGGVFVACASTKSNYYTLYYYDSVCVDYTKENYNSVQALCHNMNSNYRFVKFYHTYNEQDNTLSVQQMISNIGLDEESLFYYLQQFFEMRQVANAYLQGNIISEEDQYDQMRLNRMLLDKEIEIEESKHNEKHPHAVNPNHGSLLDYINYLFAGEQVEDLIALTIQTATQHEKITQKDLIASFDILERAIDGRLTTISLSSELPIVYTLETVANHYVLTLHPVSSEKGVVYVRLTAVCTPHEALQDYVPDATYEPQAISMLLSFAEPVAIPPMTDDLELPKNNIGKQIHHGHVLLQRKCYLQAIAVLTPIYKQLKASFFMDKKNKNDLLFQICFDLGFCYNDLHQYEKAYYYLHMCHPCGRFDYSIEYFNSLAEGRDIRVFKELAEETDLIGKSIDNIDRDDDCGSEQMMERRKQLVDYMAFLLRRRGYSQINFGYLEDAENTFRKLLDHEDSRDYAEQELKYIEKLKNKKIE